MAAQEAHFHLYSMVSGQMSGKKKDRNGHKTKNNLRAHTHRQKPQNETKQTKKTPKLKQKTTHTTKQLVQPFLHKITTL